MNLELVTTSESQTIALGEALGRLLRPGDVVGLHGELGAGKTRLVRGIAGGFGVETGGVSSPTFVVVHEYPPLPPPASHSRAPLIHVDAYRLTGAEDLESLGWDRVMDGAAPVVIEWAERIEGIGGGRGAGSGGALPARGDERRIDVMLEAIGPTDRRITLDANPLFSRRMGFEDLFEFLPGRRPGTPPPGWARDPITGRAVPPDSPTFPFVDERSRMADLNRWLSGAYRVSREIQPDDLDEGLEPRPGGGE